MFDKPDHRLQAAHALINELTVAKLDLIAHVLDLEERLKSAEAAVKVPEAEPTD